MLRQQHILHVLELHVFCEPEMQQKLPCKYHFKMQAKAACKLVLLCTLAKVGFMEGAGGRLSEQTGIVKHLPRLWHWLSQQSSSLFEACATTCPTNILGPAKIVRNLG